MTFDQKPEGQGVSHQGLRERKTNKQTNSLGQTQSFQQPRASNSESSRETEAIARDKAWHKGEQGVDRGSETLSQ